MKRSVRRRSGQFKRRWSYRKDGRRRRRDGGCVPFIANRSHLLVPFDILAHSPVHDKQYLATTINYMLPVAAYKSHNQFSSSGVLRSRCEHSRDPTCQSSNDYLRLTTRCFSPEGGDIDDNKGEGIRREREDLMEFVNLITLRFDFFFFWLYWSMEFFQIKWFRISIFLRCILWFVIR